jgi:hypothetical protein
VTREPCNTLGFLQFRCDGCDRTIRVPRHGLRWASDDRAVESVGWRPVLVGHGRFEHYCPECQADMPEPS